MISYPKYPMRFMIRARLVFVGRLHPQKGLDTLLQALQKLGQQYPGDVQLQLLGDGPLREELILLVKKF